MGAAVLDSRRMATMRIGIIESGEKLEAAGLRVTGLDANGEVRIVEWAAHPFCVGTLFVPQARSVRGKPHPVFMAFCQAAMKG